MGGQEPQRRIAIIGAGLSGMGLAIRLKQEGIEDFVVLERAEEIGGTWRDNDYPGCCCDVPSHVYSYSFALNKHWTRGFAPQWEILDYLKSVVDEHGVRSHVRFGHEVTAAGWDSEAGRWRIETVQGSISAQFIAAAVGPFSDPSTPELPGLERFKGTVFHSARWKHDHDLSGERVAAIGTGASAIQFVPAIQPDVAKLHLFQRTAPWIIPRLDHQITGFEHFFLRLVPRLEALVRAILYWTLETRVIGFRRPWVMKIADRVARWHLKRQVPDRELRRKLTPGYVMGCKRILISDNYYPSLSRPNVELVTDGISEIRERSIVAADGSEREIDTIILGTGFKVAQPTLSRDLRDLGLAKTPSGYIVPGEVIAPVVTFTPREGSMQAYRGTTVAGFPNLFFLLGPNTGLGHNSMIYMIESQIAYVIDALRTLDDRRAERFEVREDAEARYNEALQDQLKGTVWTAGQCQSWYLDDSGRNTTLWPSYSFAFRRETRRFDAEAYEIVSR